MRILGFDCATSACSAALWDDGRIVARRFEAMNRGHGEFLMPMIGDVMAQAGMEYSDLDLLAATIGPGGFTGMRIGLATARAMALAAQLPCLGVSTLEAVANSIDEAERKTGPLLVCLDSKRADIFTQAFGPDLSPLGEAGAVLPDDLAAFVKAQVKGKADGPVLVAGDVAGRAAEALAGGGVEARLSTAPGTPDAAVVCAIAAERWDGNVKISPPRPLYLRPPDAKAPKNGGRLRP
ncbi:MAG: tRNA (adenosine(37)-N6)-threonylcarbamoyltransferase complex dimerization subunit type 1 TsaB [Rhodospirillales bacterium]|nr:tRNA (adenosine(37)-N6)-threonylcarbamoyltransferase complex dimerization subunit type 1 TsaB [Rhodospirillales bacterium]